VNEQEARDALRGALVFGNDLQIRAIRFLDAVAEAVEVIREAPPCLECNGNGEIFEYDSPRDFCGEEGCGECEYLADCLACDGLGYFVVDWPACKDDVMKAAISRIKSERKRQ